MIVQVRYKQKDDQVSLYSLLPETADTQFARHMSDVQSEVTALQSSPESLTGTPGAQTNCVFLCFQLQYKQDGKKEAESNLYSLMPQTLQTEHAKHACQLQSQVRPQQIT